MKVPSTSSLSVYTKVVAHTLNDIRNWASLIGLLLRICWCLLSVFLIYCSDEWKKLVNLIYCFQVLFRMNFKIMYFLMKILGNTPSADSAASRDSLSSQNATWGIVFFSSFYWWHIEYKGWMCERLLNLQEIYVSGQNICIEVYGNSVGTITPDVQLHNYMVNILNSKNLYSKILQFRKGKYQKFCEGSNQFCNWIASLCKICYFSLLQWWGEKINLGCSFFFGVRNFTTFTVLSY